MEKRTQLEIAKSEYIQVLMQAEKASNQIGADHKEIALGTLLSMTGYQIALQEEILKRLMILAPL